MNVTVASSNNLEFDWIQAKLRLILNLNCFKRSIKHVFYNELEALL